MCSTGPFQCRWLKGYIYSSCYYHHEIGSIHPSHYYHFFPWLCVWDVCYIIFCHLLHIHSGKTGNYSLLVCSTWWVQIVGYVLACISYSFFLYITPSHYHHCANLSEDIELIKCLSDIYFVECVSTIKHILSVIQYTICGAVCFQFTHFLCDDWDNIYTLSYYHHQVGSMSYHPLLRVGSWSNCMCSMSFYALVASSVSYFLSSHKPKRCRNMNSKHAVKIRAIATTILRISPTQKIFVYLWNKRVLNIQSLISRAQ